MDIKVISIRSDDVGGRGKVKQEGEEEESFVNGLEKHRTRKENGMSWNSGRLDTSGREN